MSRRGGFTLLEVMVAVFVFAIIMGPLLTLVQQNLASLGRARLETDAALLAEERIREIQELAETDEFPEVGTDEGSFEPPHEMLRWVATVEPYSIELPQEKEERIRQIQELAETDEFPEVGTDEGTFEPPHEMLRWVATVEPYSIELPQEKEERISSSSVFALGDPATDDSEPSLRRVIVRIFPEDGEDELIDPFVTFLVTPFEPDDLPEQER